MSPQLKKIIAAVVGVVLMAAGAYFGIDFKGIVCDAPLAIQAQ